MTAEQFAYWLQGYAELNAAPPTAEQWQAIREHLALVFTKVTPKIGLGPMPYGPGVISPRQPVFTTCKVAARPVGGGDGNTFMLC